MVHADTIDGGEELRNIPPVTPTCPPGKYGVGHVFAALTGKAASFSSFSTIDSWEVVSPGVLSGPKVPCGTALYISIYIQPPVGTLGGDYDLTITFSSDVDFTFPNNPITITTHVYNRVTDICDSNFCHVYHPDSLYCNPNSEDSWNNPVCSNYFGDMGYCRFPMVWCGCIIATAAYGSPMAPEVVYMRAVRDRMIGSTPTGRVLRDVFNAWYYSWSPPVAEWISGSESLRALFRLLLTPIVLIVHVTSFIFNGLGGGDLGAIVGFLAAALLSILTYVLLPVLLMIRAVTFVHRWVSLRRSCGSLNHDEKSSVR